LDAWLDVRVLGCFAVSGAMAIVALFDIILGKMLGFALGADVFGAIAFILVAFDFLVFWIHAHCVISFK
jgi:hypothetical protein